MIANRIKYGIVGGLVGGVVFGMMMAFMGTLPMIGKMVGYPNAVVGFLMHLAISAGIGGSFGLLVGPAVTGKVSGLAAGLVYDTVWWFLGPLTLMPPPFSLFSCEGKLAPARVQGLFSDQPIIRIFSPCPVFLSTSRRSSPSGVSQWQGSFPRQFNDP